MQLKFEPCTCPVLLEGCEELVPVIESLLRGWTVSAHSGMTPDAPVIRIRRTPAGYERTSPWLAKAKTYRHPVNAACDFLVDLIKALNADQPDMMCLHSAAVAFPSGLVVIPDTYKSGKSTLAAHLVAAGVPVFGDDVLPVRGEAGLGVAVGILPRLRLPLPATSPPDFETFVAAHRGPASPRFLYLDLPHELLPPFGATAPIAGFVELHRVDDPGEPELLPGNRSELMKKTILRNFARELPSADILDQIHALIAAADCYTLRYSAADTAARLLQRTFAAPAAGAASA